MYLETPAPAGEKTQWLWTWGGECFGYHEGDELWTYNGRHVGRFDRHEEVYARDGRYLGEVMSNDRLITKTSKKSWRREAFEQHGRRGADTRYANHDGYLMYAGHEEFPSPDALN